MDDENQAEIGEEEKRSGGKKWLFIALGVILLLGAAGGGFYFFGFSAEADEPVAGEDAQTLDRVNDVFALEPLVVNLADESNTRYARIGMSLGLISSTPGETIIDEGLMIPKLRDHCLVVVGQRTSTELLTPEVKDILKQDLVSFINKSLDPAKGKVAEIYFTEFIIQ